MKTLCLIALSLLAMSANAEIDQQELIRFFHGSYDFIGVTPDTQNNYSGKAKFEARQGYLDVTREINGIQVNARASLEKTAMADAYVLRMRFKENNIDFEETCLFHADLDNYARLTCYLYQPEKQTHKPGMEAYFFDRNSP
ncbi:MAG: hypothetical protein OQL06_08995 [Gammaproteobacteria bacterium]|nr:hypothetical protein [Gammaproteobacteria bacterium]